MGLNFGNVGETGVVANLGSIVVDAQNVGTGFNVDSSGIAIANLDGRLFNSGTILSTLNGDAGNAITVSDGTGVVEIETSSALTRGMTVADWWGVTDRTPNALFIGDLDASGFFDLLTSRLESLA